jgi:hypothetical protein
MKVVSVNKKELVDALGQVTHAGFDGQGWSWQVFFDPKDTRAEAKVVLVNPDVDEEVNYRLVNEEGYNVLDFAELNGYVWDAGNPLPDDAARNIKTLEQIRLSKEARAFIESHLCRQVTIGKDTFHVEYY